MRELALFLLICTGLVACSPKPESSVTNGAQLAASENKADEGLKSESSDGSKPQALLTELSNSSEAELVIHQQNNEPKKMEKPLEQETLLSGHLKVAEKHDKNGNLAVVLTVHNPQNQALQLEFRSGMSADLILLDNEKPIWKWSSDMMFSQAINHKAMKAGESTEYSFAIPKAKLENLKAKEYALRAEFKGIATEMKGVTINPVYGKLLVKSRQL